MVLFWMYLCMCIFLLVQNVFFQQTTCSPASGVLELLENRYGVRIYDASLTVDYDLDKIQVNRSGSRVSLIVNVAHVDFSGSVKTLDEVGNLNIKVRFDAKPIVIQRTKKRRKDDAGPSCELVSSENYDLRLGLSQNVEAVITQLVEYRMEVDVCSKFDYIVENAAVVSSPTSNETREPPPTPSTKANPSQQAKFFWHSKLGPKDQSCGVQLPAGDATPQSTINAMVDFGFLVLLRAFQVPANGSVALPDISTNFSTGSSFYEISGDFLAANGTFQDITTLKRIGDVTIDHERQRFWVGGTIQLAKTKVFFDHYKIRYGLITVHGHLGVDFHGVTLNVQLAMDFNGSPCRVYLSTFQLEQIGDYDVDFTGLGYLNGATQKLIGWVIRRHLFGGLRDAIAWQLYSLDCEQFRPRMIEAQDLASVLEQD